MKTVVIKTWLGQNIVKKMLSIVPVAWIVNQSNISLPFRYVQDVHDMHVLKQKEFKLPDKCHSTEVKKLTCKRC